MPECTHAPDSWASAIKEPRRRHRQHQSDCAPSPGTGRRARRDGCWRCNVCRWVVQSSGSRSWRPKSGLGHFRFAQSSGKKLPYERQIGCSGMLLR
eukprot:1572034-Prymnesium_polylepis.1